jgi:hypothetical protein
VKIGASNRKECIAGRGESRMGRFEFGELERKSWRGGLHSRLRGGIVVWIKTAHSPLVTQGEPGVAVPAKSVQRKGAECRRSSVGREGNYVVCLPKSDVHLPFGSMPLLKTERFCVVRQSSSARNVGKRKNWQRPDVSDRRTRCIVLLQGHGRPET